MSWIKDFAKASFKLYSGNTIDAFQPLDFFHFYPLWYDLWVKRFMSVMDVLQCEHKSYEELKNLLPPPSSMRAVLQKLIPTFVGINKQTPGNFARMANFFARMLKESCTEDPFGFTHNPIHSRQELNQAIKLVPWQNANTEIAKHLGRLITAAGSLVHGLYNDVVTDFGWDAYGPYNIVTPKENFQIIIRHFPDLSPSEIWENKFFTPIKDIKIYQFYQDVEWELAFLGCHTVLKSGNPISGLKYFAVSINGKFVNNIALEPIIDELSQKATEIYQHIKKMGFEELKKLVMVQECYQLHKMFTAAYMNWQPTSEMLERVTNKPLSQGLLPFGKLMTNLEEYKELFHLNTFEEEALGQNGL